MPNTDARSRLPRWRAIRAWPTARAVGLTVLGVTALGIGIPTATVDLIRLGTFIVALPLLDGMLTIIWRPRMAVARLPSNPPLQVGVPSVLGVSISGSTRLLRVAELHDRVPTMTRLEPELGHDEEGQDDRLRTARAATVVTPTSRGALTLGPVTVATVDPLGAFRLRGTVGPRVNALVWPRTVDLPFADRLRTELTESIAATGFEANQAWDDATVREYREGDGLRRVHWRSTARRGTLMVRADAPSTSDLVTVALCAPPHECPDEEREELVSIATSLALTVLDDGARTSLTTAPAWMRRAPSSSAIFSGRSARTLLLDTAALLDANSTLGPAMAAGPPPPRTPGLLVTVSRSDDLQAYMLAQVNGTRGLAVLVDFPDRGDGTATSLPSLLTDAGWQVITWRRP